MKVLIADDEPVARTLLSHWLASWGYEVISVDDGAAAVAALDSDPSVRLAIVDWMMPGKSGVEVVKHIRARDTEAYVYVMLVTARDDMSDLVEGLDAGADDYVVKPCNPTELQVRLRAGRRTVELHEQLARAREALRFEATHDALTGLSNRRAAERVLDQECARACRMHTPLSVLLFDLDRFKSINDAFGHAAGDAVLTAAARTLASGVRAYDHVARHGGEEFLVILPGCTSDEAAAVADRLRASIAAELVSAAGGEIRFTTSVGVAALSAECSDPRSLLSAADAALYRAKRLGRNRTELASSITSTPADNHMESQVTEQAGRQLQPASPQPALSIP